MGLWRCLNPECAENDDGIPVFDFDGEKPVCPKCGTDRKTAPNKIAERACIHFITIDPAGPIRTQNGSRLIACSPALRKLPPHATGEPDGVTCPKCRDSQLFKNVGVQHQPITPLPEKLPEEVKAALRGE